ncbi:phage head closure protein [Acinetobacter sp. ULE_I001]|uniref:phage head closure protein n=1 Tax=unclassified Acinetobacter TaxID=196816 RepID=UPI002656B036|nr:phage head closure protein [Acinetobacter sp.]MDN5489943.1 phage head closure protein [Acinetobacter sp.]MDN5648757.1 phage head closure protein [Acinetobacter sp.]
MNLGTMNKLCIIEKKIIPVDEYNNELEPIWQEFTKLYGSFQPLSSKDLISAKAAGVNTKARLVTHFVDGIDSTMRISIHGLSSVVQTFSIDGDPQPDLKSNREYLTFNLVKDA